MLESINSFVKKTLLLGVLVGIVTLSLPFIQGISTETPDNTHVIAEFINTLPAEIRDEKPAKVVVNIERMVDSSNTNATKSEQQEIQLTELKSKFEQTVNANSQEIEKLQLSIQNKDNQIAALSEQNKIQESTFLSKIASLNRDINAYGASINPYTPFTDRKREVNKKIQTILAELNFYDGEIDGDNKKTRDALISYQKSKGFAKLGYFAWTTSSEMVKDHFNSAGTGVL